MADFLTSTHRAKWVFSPQDLKEKYKAANQRARQMLEKYGATRMEVDLDGSLAYPEPHSDSKDNAEKHSRSKPLKIEEEQLLRAFYEFKIQDLVRQKKIMYQQKSLSLGFDLIVFSPYRSLDGFVNDMEDYIQANNDYQLQKLKDLHETAKMEADKTMLTDAPLLFPPGQLALAALRRSNELHGVLDFERYLKSILSRQHPALTVAEFTVSLNAVDFLVSKLITPTAVDMKHIDRKLKSCRNPGSHDKSKKRKHWSRESSNELHKMG